MMQYHDGIRIDHITAQEGGGLIFALGTGFIFMLAFPTLLPLAGACLVIGAALAPVLHRWYY
jgi:hypothetical protein